MTQGLRVSGTRGTVATQPSNLLSTGIQELLRSVAAEMQERVSQFHSCGGTQELLTMTSMGVYVTTFHAKIDRRKRGKGSQSQSSSAAMGRRLILCHEAVGQLKSLHAEGSTRSMEVPGLV